MFPCLRRLLLVLLSLDQRRMFASAKPLCREVYGAEGDQWRNCVVEIGGLAIQGADAFHKKEGQTFETYLTRVLNASYGLEFKAIALNFNQNFEYVSDSRLDFIYSNPAAYTCMMVEFRLATVASLLNFRKGNALNKFAGVIFARANATQFNSTEDLRNATIAAVSISGLGAMQLQQADLLRRNLDIMTDVKRLVFTGNQNKIVEDVESGYADVGFVRTDMIDRSVAAGTTKWEYFKAPAPTDFEYEGPGAPLTPPNRTFAASWSSTLRAAQSSKLGTFGAVEFLPQTGRAARHLLPARPSVQCNSRGELVQVASPAPAPLSPLDAAMPTLSRHRSAPGLGSSSNSTLERMSGCLVGSGNRVAKAAGIPMQMGSPAGGAARLMPTLRPPG
eukprot:TRINITY_DN816_c0_g2_i2.p1 TRINITY_DN816_c0_g2~~TRINITY_DN816_c0_g2_i2.p1  ORF type:complete len:390 (-),score=69.30 TRINITY_DN816_c0_g2_i2:96-1265(-)